MRYWLLVILLYALFFLIVRHAAPEWEGTTGYYAGLFICSLIAMVITWRDTPGWFDKGHCCKVSDEAAFCLIQRPYISKTLLTRRISPRGSP